MKIVCESCGAKYSIADDRVSGKMFKIRCKRCSEVIVVRGDQQAPSAAAVSSASAPTQNAIWHVVVEGEQAGPYTPAQLGEMLTQSTVDWDAYVWAEGFENWVPMRDVEDLVGQITGQQPQSAQAPASYRPSNQTLTGQPSMGADPFADESAANLPDPFASAPQISAGPDLFARGGAQPAAGAFGGAGEEAGVMSSSPSPRMAAERAMTGARNENSVLFSLKNLQALATGSPSAPPAVAGAGPGGGFAGGEGSGLIDIRALATTTGVGEDGRASGHKDELLSIGSQGGAFGTLGSPMLSRVGDDGDSGKKTILWAVVAGVGLVSIALVAAAYILRPAIAPAASAVGVAPPIAAQAPVVAVAAAPTAAAAPSPQPRNEAPSEGELAARRATEEQDRQKDADKGASKHESSGGDHHHKHEGASAKTASNNEPAPAAEPEPTKKPAAKSGPRSIDDLLDGALQGSSSSKAAHGAADTKGESNLPLTPSRDDVKAAMNGVAPAVQACAKGAGGVAIVTVNVAGATGRVTTAEVNGVAGPVGSCIAQAARKAQFAKFSQHVFKVAFPYKL